MTEDRFTVQAGEIVREIRDHGSLECHCSRCMQDGNSSAPRVTGLIAAALRAEAARAERLRGVVEYVRTKMGVALEVLDDTDQTGTEAWCADLLKEALAATDPAAKEEAL